MTATTVVSSSPRSLAALARPSAHDRDDDACEFSTMSWTDRPVHPVTLWRGRLTVALDALESGGASAGRQSGRTKYQRRSPVETTNVQLPTGDRLLVPTGAETLRLKGFLIMSRNSRRDFADFADMVDVMDAETAAVVLAGMDRYYCGQ